MNLVVNCPAFPSYHFGRYVEIVDFGKQKSSLMRDAVDSSYTGRDAYGRDITYDRAQSSETRDAFGRDERGPRRGGYEGGFLAIK